MNEIKTLAEEVPTLFPDYHSFAGDHGAGPNNFYAHFFNVPGNNYSDVYRNLIETELLKADHPRLDGRLCELVTRLYPGKHFSQEWNDEVTPLLYVAYRFMETYKEVQEKLKSDIYCLYR